MMFAFEVVIFAAVVSAAQMDRRDASLADLDRVQNNLAQVQFMNMPTPSNEPDVSGLKFCDLQDFGMKKRHMVKYFQDSPTTRAKGANFPAALQSAVGALVQMGHRGNSLEQAFSKIFEFNEIIATYLALFSGHGDDDKNFGAEETQIVTMFVMSRAMHRVPGLHVQIERIYQLVQSIVGGSSRTINWSQVVFPATLPATYRDPACAIDVLNQKLTTLRSTKNGVLREAANLWTKMHARVFKELLEQWQTIPSALNKRRFIGYLSNPTSLGNELAAQTWFMAIFPNYRFFPDTYVTPSAAGLRLRRELLNSFIRTALIDVAQSNDNAMLSTVIVGIWQARPQGFFGAWDRYLYIRSFRRGAVVSWRSWIQTELLQITSSNPQVKELVKSTLEDKTKKSRTDEKEAWSATDLQAALKNV